MDHTFHILYKSYNNLTWTLVTFVLTLLIVRYFQRRRSIGGVGKYPYPPGPWGLPIIGHLPFLGSNPMPTLAEYRKRYGDIFSIQLGSYPAVVLNGTDVIRKALITNPDDLAGRPQLYSYKLLTAVRGESGIAFSDYSPAWKALRRISNNSLKMFTANKQNPVTHIIVEEARRLADHFAAHNGQPVDPLIEITLAGGSVMYQLLFGRNSNAREDKNYIQMVKTLADFVEFANSGNPVDVMPWTRFIFRTRLKRFLETTRVSDVIYTEQMEQHKKTFDKSHLRDITDALILASLEMTEAEKRLGLSTIRITSVINDLLGAGTEGVTTTLSWAILYMATYPHVQAKVQAEIDKHIGSSRAPTYDDRKYVPYVEATLLEVNRKATIAPLALPHSTTRDVDLMGYRIPKDTFVFVNLASTCNDESVWEDPALFCPERFLSLEGLDSSKADLLLSFGAGRRRCIGESFAKMEMFLLFVSIMQHCTFRKTPGELYNFNTTFGLTLKPAPFTVVVEHRSE